MFSIGSRFALQAFAALQSIGPNRGLTPINIRENIAGPSRRPVRQRQGSKPNRYTPHQGRQERARRQSRQAAAL